MNQTRWFNYLDSKHQTYIPIIRYNCMVFNRISSFCNTLWLEYTIQTSKLYSCRLKTNIVCNVSSLKELSYHIIMETPCVIIGQICVFQQFIQLVEIISF